MSGNLLISDLSFTCRIGILLAKGVDHSLRVFFILDYTGALPVHKVIFACNALGRVYTCVGK